MITRGLEMRFNYHFYIGLISVSRISHSSSAAKYFPKVLDGERNGKSRRQRLRSLRDRVRSPLTVFHLHSKGEEKGEEGFPRPRAIHFRAKLSRGGIAIKRSVSLAASSSPSPRYLRNHSRATSLSTIFILRPPSTPPCLRFALRRRVRRAAFR